MWIFCGKAEFPHSFGYLSTKFPHQEIGWNYEIFRNVSFISQRKICLCKLHESAKTLIAFMLLWTKYALHKIDLQHFQRHEANWCKKQVKSGRNNIILASKYLAFILHRWYFPGKNGFFCTSLNFLRYFKFFFDHVCRLRSKNVVLR